MEFCDVVQPLRKHLAGKTANRETGLHLPSLHNLVIRMPFWGVIIPEATTSPSNTAQPRENQVLLYGVSMSLRASVSFRVGARGSQPFHLDPGVFTLA